MHLHAPMVINNSGQYYLFGRFTTTVIPAFLSEPHRLNRNLINNMGNPESELPIHLDKKEKKKWTFVSFWNFFCFVIFAQTTFSLLNYYQCFKSEKSNRDSLCPIVEKIDPSSYMYESDTIKTILYNEDFHNSSLEKLLGAVRYPTQIYDKMINPNSADSLEDLYKLEPKWAEFEKFHSYLAETFPLVHKHLKLEKINKFGLVYTWEGSEASKKPIMLTAHYDVVPVQPATVDQWTFPPFEGGFDGKYLYGRGVSDCKNLLIGLMETVELLLSEQKFSPKRTIVLAFGYDEEAAGTGAFEINKHLEAKYGEDSFFQIIDEGNSGYTEENGQFLILPATGEKGHLNSVIDIFTPGGHSSVPPKHTSIGLLAKLISLIEDQEFESILSNANPVLNQLQCVAEHSTTIDKDLKKNILKAHLDKKANAKVVEFMASNIFSKYLVTTSQAVDIVEGGVKSNALPEHASVLVNHRIAVEESVASTGKKVLDQIVDFAEKYDLGVISNDALVRDKTPNGYIDYNFVEPLEPAPLTPVGDEVWNVFGGSLRYLYEELVFPEKNDTFIFAPFISTGNTDTKSYWSLTRNIFRYEPGLPTPRGNIHSVDERLNFDGHLLIIAFYYYYLQVVDGI
ncbi:Peptidase M20/M25/M40 family protein [Clavispora lusitaniae]|uniref:Peptidase M20/M25/M40 family protein n=1 Tax=Clavispora lusitaniae TaxID=36911 RepID=UPI00202C642A|nr:Peptidase M20/M25/M40 family protein [Clavispora lusitaniae]